MAQSYSNSWTETTTAKNYWKYNINSGTINELPFSVGTGDVAPINPFGETDLSYKIGKDRYFYAVDDNSIKVDKGSPSKARYAVFYAVNKDPVIFCRTRREMIKEVKKLLKRKEVDYKSIRIFALIGGAKKVVKR